MDHVSACERTVENAYAVVATVQPGQLGAPTPCGDWDVRSLITHMTELCAGFASALGVEPPVSGAGAALDTADPAAGYKQSAEAMMRGWRTPGALDRTLTMPWGQMPATLGAQLVVGDHLIHTWDLSRALGRTYVMDEELANATLGMMERILTPELRAAGAGFGAAVPCPEDAPVQDRLLALSGRRP
jgi:uncharacterized protein (TIGR03086 family)